MRCPMKNKETHVSRSLFNKEQTISQKVTQDGCCKRTSSRFVGEHLPREIPARSKRQAVRCLEWPGTKLRVSSDGVWAQGYLNRGNGARYLLEVYCMYSTKRCDHKLGKGTALIPVADRGQEHRWPVRRSVGPCRCTPAAREAKRQHLGNRKVASPITQYTITTSVSLPTPDFMIFM